MVFLESCRCDGLNPASFEVNGNTSTDLMGLGFDPRCTLT